MDLDIRHQLAGGAVVAHQTSGGMGPGFESSISHKDPDALMYKIRIERETYR